MTNVLTGSWQNEDNKYTFNEDGTGFLLNRKDETGVATTQAATAAHRTPQPALMRLKTVSFTSISATALRLYRLTNPQSKTHQKNASHL
ncbi:MAG: hypothetical protein IJR60_03400 [Eubacterium sp.]|nr:hypothetical protein [Eubacterium sp.]